MDGLKRNRAGWADRAGTPVTAVLSAAGGLPGSSSASAARSRALEPRIRPLVGHREPSSGGTGGGVVGGAQGLEPVVQSGLHGAEPFAGAIADLAKHQATVVAKHHGDTLIGGQRDQRRRRASRSPTDPVGRPRAGRRRRRGRSAG